MLLNKKQLHFSSHMGRMGNQMFQYACAQELRHHHGFSTSLSHLDKLHMFELGFLERLRHRLHAFLFFRLFKPLFGMASVNTEAQCLYRDFREDLLRLEGPTTIWGFFQAPIYFERSRALLERHFRLKSPHQHSFQRFLQRCGLTPGSYLAVHLRRTDYKGFTITGMQGDDFTLPLAYYERALQQAGWNGPIVFVSDDPEETEQLFHALENKHISREDAPTDFLILQHAAIAVLSNSTFAWWAGWLNRQAQAIYCPRYFLGFKEQREVPAGIYPEGWIQIDFSEGSPST